jgi:hypothetical protein
VKVPTVLLAPLDGVAKRLGTSKTKVVIAILNEGLDTADEEQKGRKAPAKPVVPKERRCTRKDCGRQKAAKGLCGAHYVAQRRGERA